MTRIILLRRNTAYALEPHTAIGRRVHKVKKEAIFGRVDQIRSRRKQDPLTGNAYSTQNTQDCADSITGIAAYICEFTDIRPTLRGRRSAESNTYGRDKI